MKLLMRTAVSLVAAVSMVPPQISAQAPPLWGSLVPGRHDVGFERVWTFDKTRIWPRSASLDSLRGQVLRPIRIDVWYPAVCEAAAKMSLRGYLEMKAPDPAYEDLVFLTHRWDEYSYRGLASDSASFDRLMNVPTSACLEGAHASGRFPLVLYSAGWFNRAPDNTILAEYLASHGYVVAAVPQLNPGLWTYSFRSDPVSIENQVRDLEVALGTLIERAFVDRRRIVASGYSTGGDVALLLQGRNPLVDAVVALDASWTLSPDNDVNESSLFDPTNHTEPVVVLRRPLDADSPGGGVLDELTRAARVVVEIPGADHGSFSDDPAERYLLGTDSKGHVETHAAVARALLKFLQAAVGSEASPDWASLARSYQEDGLIARHMEATQPEPAQEE